ncbi:MAG: hypothetical protein JNK31_07950 [Candidatus Competibacter sp.]|nr:hypothetical protein [Candidatus Competibacter sp.]
MNQLGYLIAIPVLALSAGCANMTPTEQGTLSGAAIGAASGAAVGGLTGGDAGVGALIGGAAGAVVGNIYGQNQEYRRPPPRRRYRR